MTTPDLDSVEKLAVIGKDPMYVRRLLKIPSDQKWLEYIWNGWKVLDWDGVREIACHRRARRILSTLEHN